MKEGYDPVRDAENIAEEVYVQAEKKEHQVGLPLNIILRLHDELLHSQGIYIYPEEANELAEEEWNKDEQNKVLLVARRLRADLPIDPIGRQPIMREGEENKLVSISLRERDMDTINECILVDVDQARMDLADWWIGAKSNETTEDLEKERTIWRDIYLKGAQEALVLLKEVNTAFMSGGVPPRPSYIKYFEGPLLK